MEQRSVDNEGRWGTWQSPCHICCRDGSLASPGAPHRGHGGCSLACAVVPAPVCTLTSSSPGLGDKQRQCYSWKVSTHMCSSSLSAYYVCECASYNKYMYMLALSVCVCMQVIHIHKQWCKTLLSLSTLIYKTWCDLFCNKAMLNTVTWRAVHLNRQRLSNVYVPQLPGHNKISTSQPNWQSCQHQQQKAPKYNYPLETTLNLASWKSLAFKHHEHDWPVGPAVSLSCWQWCIDVQPGCLHDFPSCVSLGLDATLSCSGSGNTWTLACCSWMTFSSHDLSAEQTKSQNLLLHLSFLVTLWKTAAGIESRGNVCCLELMPALNCLLQHFWLCVHPDLVYLQCLAGILTCWSHCSQYAGHAVSPTGFVRHVRNLVQCVTVCLVQGDTDSGSCASDCQRCVFGFEHRLAGHVPQVTILQNFEVGWLTPPAPSVAPAHSCLASQPKCCWQLKGTQNSSPEVLHWTNQQCAKHLHLSCQWWYAWCGGQCCCQTLTVLVKGEPPHLLC